MILPPSVEASLAEDYNSKNASYFACSRPEMLTFVPTDCRRILDVGCGRGAFARNLRQRIGCEVWGVEPDAASVTQAKGNLDKVIHGYFSPNLNLPERHFDCILFNDVLEHLLDPLPALQYALYLLAQSGVVVASIPNVGHFPTVWRLAVQGEWKYKERGILDQTHLRFYTRRSIQELFQKAGLAIQQLHGINPFFCMETRDKSLWWRYHAISWLPLPGIRDMRYLQFAVVAVKQ